MTKHYSNRRLTHVGLESGDAKASTILCNERDVEGQVTLFNVRTRPIISTRVITKRSVHSIMNERKLLAELKNS